MTHSVWITLGRVGFGVSGGLFPELRLGVVAIGWCRGAIGRKAREMRRTLETLVQDWSR